MQKSNFYNFIRQNYNYRYRNNKNIIYMILIKIIKKKLFGLKIKFFGIYKFLFYKRIYKFYF